MNDGIVSITERYIDRITNNGNLPAKPVQTPGKLNNQIDWKSVGINGWSVISDSMFETIKKSNNFSFLNRFVSKATFAGGTLPYISGVLMVNGKIILVPFNSTTTVVYDPNNDTATIAGGTYAGSSAFSSGVLLLNGEILFIPRSTACRVYNPFTNTVRTIGIAPSPTNSYITGVLMQDGRVYCIPNATTTAIIIDPINNTVKNAGGTFGPATNFLGYGGALLPDGRIFICPNQANIAGWIYDPVKDSLSLTKSIFTHGGQGCMMLPDETIFVGSGATNTNPMIFDWKKDTVKIITKVVLPNGASGGTTLLPDGTIMLHSLAGPSLILYNPYTETAINVPGTINNSDFTNGTMLFDGRYIMFPRNSTSLVGYGVKGSSFSKEVLLSAHYNLRR